MSTAVTSLSGKEKAYLEGVVIDTEKPNVLLARINDVSGILSRPILTGNSRVENYNWLIECAQKLNDLS